MNATISDPSGKTWHEMTERTSRDTPKGRIAALVAETRWVEVSHPADGGAPVTTTRPDKYAVVVETTKPGEQARRSWRPVDSIAAGEALIAEQFSRIP